MGFLVQFDSLGCPCTRDCPERTGGCQAKCARYKTYEGKRNRKYREKLISYVAMQDTYGRKKCRAKFLKDEKKIKRIKK